MPFLRSTIVATGGTSHDHAGWHRLCRIFAVAAASPYRFGMPLTTESVKRWRRKAGAVVTAWESKYGRKPGLKTVIAVLAVAQHETACGDAWPGEHNWGACTLRGLTGPELNVLVMRGLYPTVRNRRDAEVVARNAQQALLDHGLVAPSLERMAVKVPRSSIHCDSRPVANGSVAYFTWFANFDNDIDGAKYLIAVLCGAEIRKAAYSVLVTDANLNALARAMYDAHYYTGFYERDRDYNGTKGSELNIASYAAALRRIEPEITAALAASVPPTIQRGSQGAAVSDWQRKIGTNPDGKFGIATATATRLWQLTHGLKADGIVGPKTWTKAGFRQEAWTP